MNKSPGLSSDFTMISRCSPASPVAMLEGHLAAFKFAEDINNLMKHAIAHCASCKNTSKCVCEPNHYISICRLLSSKQSNEICKHLRKTVSKVLHFVLDTSHPLPSTSLCFMSGLQSISASSPNAAWGRHHNFGAGRCAPVCSRWYG